MAENEVERLRALYRSLGDEELLRLAGSRDGLTADAQAAVDAELDERGLVFPLLEDEPAPSLAAPADDEEPWVILHVFGVSVEADLAFRKLNEHEVPARMDFAEQQLEENGPRVRTNWLAVFVPASRQAEAQRVLQRELNLFPASEQGYRDPEESADGEEVLFVVGTFDDANDAALARKALHEANIWFQAGVDEDAVTTIEVKAEDMEAALAAVEGGFTQADD